MAGGCGGSVLPADFARGGCRLEGIPSVALSHRGSSLGGRDTLYRPAASRDRRNKTSNRSARRRYSSRPPASSATCTSQARPGSRNITPAGHLLKHYAVGQELPSSPLVAMAPAVLADSHEPELVIATAQDGLLAFNGRVFPANLSAGCRCAHHHLGLARCFRTSLDWNQEARRARSTTERK